MEANATKISCDSCGGETESIIGVIRICPNCDKPSNKNIMWKVLSLFMTTHRINSQDVANQLGTYKETVVKALTNRLEDSSDFWGQMENEYGDDWIDAVREVEGEGDSK